MTTKRINTPNVPEYTWPPILPGTTVGGKVGTFSADFTLRNRDGANPRALTGTVDTGASFTIVPGHILDEMGVTREEQALFSLADGSVQELSIGLAEMDLEGSKRSVYVVFGTDHRKTLLGAMALESFGLAADAKNHRLIPAELML